MNIKEYIEEKYDVRDRIKNLTKDPIRVLLDKDIFAYDFIELDDSGRPVKMLWYNGGEDSIPVQQLISYSKDEIETLPKDIRELYDTYTAQYDFDEDFLRDPLNFEKMLKEHS